MEWVALGRTYVHLADDKVDGGPVDAVAAARRDCRLGALALELYTHPFFVQNMAVLKYAMLRSFHAYEHSVRWEKSELPWQRNYSDWARHGWLDVCLTVGDICSGYDRTAAEYPEMMAMAYANHHAVDGAPK